MIRRTTGLLSILLLASAALGQPVLRSALLPTETGEETALTKSHRALAGFERIPSNSIIDMELFGPTLWLATGGGLSRFDPSLDFPDPTDGDWFVCQREDGFGRGGVSGLAIGTTSTGDTIVWAATALDTLIGGESLPAGGGVGYSLDRGESWTWMPQPVDSLGDPDIAETVTNVQNVTYDIALLDGRAWTASWGGGLRYYERENPEQGWVNRPPDDDSFDVQAHLNHRAFSLAVLNGQLWVGTAAGVNRSDDGGESWVNHAFEQGNENSLSGNFIPALGAQTTSTGREIIWAATWVVSSENGEFYGVSKSEDGGTTWDRVLGGPEEPLRVHNFAFQDTLVYVASDDGFYKSADFGESWARFPRPRDNVTGFRFYEDQVYSAAAEQAQLWLGGPEGLALSRNGGLDWRIVRAYPEPGVEDTPTTYAYPVPFSPSRFPVVRIQYQLNAPADVTLEIYDFAMELLTRPVKSAYRSAGEHNEVWNGRGPTGEEIANGVYFYRLTLGNDEHWGKILVLD